MPMWDSSTRNIQNTIVPFLFFLSPFDYYTATLTCYQISGEDTFYDDKLFVLSSPISKVVRMSSFFVLVASSSLCICCI